MITFWVLYLPALSLSIFLRIKLLMDLIVYSLNASLFFTIFSIYKTASAWLITSKCSLKVLPPIVIPSSTTFVSLSVRVLPSIALELYIYLI